jgi:hypothetical protein
MPYGVAATSASPRCSVRHRHARRLRTLGIGRASGLLKAGRRLRDHMAPGEEASSHSRLNRPRELVARRLGVSGHGKLPMDGQLSARWRELADADRKGQDHLRLRVNGRRARRRARRFGHLWAGYQPKLAALKQAMPGVGSTGSYWVWCHPEGHAPRACA